VRRTSAVSSVFIVLCCGGERNYDDAVRAARRQYRRRCENLETPGRATHRAKRRSESVRDDK
jgi:hypothetical protein